MRVFFQCFFLLFIMTGVVQASCSSIKDADAKAYCRAKNEGATCGYINDRDLKAKCKTEMGNSF